MKKWMCLCLVAILLSCFSYGCGEAQPPQDTSNVAETIESTTSKKKSPVEEMREAQKNFTYGTYTTSVFENAWLNLKFTPYSNMYSNPEVDKKFNEFQEKEKGEYIQKSMMEFYVKKGSSSNGGSSVYSQKLQQISTAKEYLQLRVEELKKAYAEYPQLSLNCGEQGTLEFCGEEYEYQKFSTLGGVNGATDGIYLCRILDGYAILVSVTTGHYTIEEQLSRFEAIR